VPAGGGIGSLVAGPGSDFSEEPVLGFEPAALEPVAAPLCPPGPVAAARASVVIWAVDDVRRPAFEGADARERSFVGGT
jgi:hypothetical protein